MGIKNYQSNLIDEFPDIIVKKPKNIKYLCIDLNMILHQICHKTNNNECFAKLIDSELNKLIKKNNPSFISIFTDGQAILAKAHTQIKRRNKYLYTKSSGISPLNLTPGTTFMNFVDSHILEYLKTVNIKSYYSSSKENNEGEIKMFNWLQNNKIFNNVCIIGNDSDLIVLALANKPLLNVFIYNGKQYISLLKLIFNLSNLVYRKFQLKNHPVRNDFVLLSLFQGNDYNSKIADFKKLMHAYKALQRDNEGHLITKDNLLNLITIKKLLAKINFYESDEIYSFNDIIQYLRCIQWNLNLYNGNSITNFIPKELNINIATLVKKIPAYLKRDNIKYKNMWLHPDVYLLLLMPSTGINFLPERLRNYMKPESPIFDLFPLPCNICICFKNRLKEIENLQNDDTTYKNELSKCNIEYNSHIKEFHSNKSLPIKRITEAVLKSNNV